MRKFLISRHHFIQVLAALTFAFVAGASFADPAKQGEMLIPVEIIVEEAPDIDAWFRKAGLAMKAVQTKSSCLAHGGEWVRMGLAGSYGCYLPTPDAGKVCSNDSDCAMICSPNRDDSVPSRVGRCSPSYNVFGCQRGMKRGWSTTKICID